MILSLLFLALVFAGLVIVPLLLLKGLLHLVIWIVVLPFRIVGAVLGIVFGILGGVAGLLFGGMGLLIGLVAVAASLVLLPLLPFVLLFGVVWLAVRAGSRRPTTLRRTV